MKKVVENLGGIVKIEITKTYHDDEKTKIYLITYHKKDNYDIWHREDGPAYQYFYENGQLNFESYWINNVKHREDGPAVVRYNENGSIARKQYYINGKELTEKQFKMKMRLKGTLLEGKY